MLCEHGTTVVVRDLTIDHVTRGKVDLRTVVKPVVVGFLEGRIGKKSYVTTAIVRDHDCPHALDLLLTFAVEDEDQFGMFARLKGGARFDWCDMECVRGGGRASFRVF